MPGRLVEKLIRPGAALLVAVVLAACAAGSNTESFPTGVEDEALTQQADASLFEFVAPKLNGGQVVGSELQNKDVALWFWAPW